MRLQRLLSAALFVSSLCAQTVSLTNTSAYTQDFNSLANSGTTNNTLPQGWSFANSSTTLLTSYRAGTGSDNTGAVYSYGSSVATDRAFGSLASNGTANIFLGAAFTNNTGATITSLAISYTGEQWRNGGNTAAHKLQFQYSLDATSLSTGTWVNVTALDFTSPTTTTTAAALDGNATANRSALSSSISSLNIATGATFRLRFFDTNDSGNDHGLAIDDFSLTPTTSGSSPCPTITLSPTSLPAASTSSNYSASFSASGSSSSPYTFTVTAGSLPPGLTLSGSTLSGTPTTAGNYNFTLTASDSATPPCTGSQAFTLAVSAPLVLTSINQIQGAGIASPLLSQSLTTEGIVTGRRSNGFFLQNAEADYDADPNTSEALFVFTSSAPSVSPGDRVRVTGTVAEFAGSGPTAFSTTQLTSPTTTTLSTGNTLPSPIAVDDTLLTPTGGFQQLERLESMRVSFASLTVVAPTDGNLSETNATSTSTGFFYTVITGTATPFREPGVQTPLTPPTCAAGSACAIPTFDGNPERIQLDDVLTGSPTLNARTGQTLQNLTGILSFAFGSYQFYPDPTPAPVLSGAGIPEGTAPLPKSSELTIASYNLERFYNSTDDPGGDAILTATAFQNRLNKLSLAIRNNLHLPDIIGFQEVENLSTLQAVASKVNTDAGLPNLYTAFLSDANDPGLIDTGYLVKNTVNVSSVEQIGLTATYTNPCTSTLETLNDRTPLVLNGSITKNNRTLDFTLINSHQRSLNGIDDESACSNGPRVRAKRRAQSEFLANYIQSRQVSSPNLKLISIGDMNGFEFNDGYVDVIGITTGNPAPATQVVEAGSDLVSPNLENLLSLIPDPTQRYSYVFEGSHQTLDHLLFSQSAALQVTGGGYVRLNADFPEVDRNDANSPRRLSDHDPGLIYLTTAQPITSGLTILRGGLTRNLATNTWNGSLILRNTGTAPLTGPFTVTITNLPQGAALANAAGSTFQGSYILSNSTTLAPGAFLSLPVSFTNPSNLTINYSARAYSGSF